MSDAALGLRASLNKPRLYKDGKRVYSINLPGIGRVGFTMDRGEGGLFSSALYETRLSLRHLSPLGDLIEARDCGSGLVTNVGALALAYDGLLTIGPSAAPANLLANTKFHAWGGKSTAAAQTDIHLTELKKPNETEATEGTNTVTTNGEGKPKLVSKAKIKAESSFEVLEWGIHTAKILSATTGTPLTAKSATSGTSTGTALTASSTTVKGESLHIVEAEKPNPIWGLITANSTSVFTVPAWYKQSTGAVEEPEATSAYKIKPVMFDHRVIAGINVESGNEIEFVWELEIKAGG